MMLAGVLAALIIGVGAATAEEAGAPDSTAAFEIFGGLGGGIGWADGVEEGDFTGVVLALYHVYEQSVSVAVEYETDVEAALLGATGEVPEDQWTKLGVAYRAPRGIGAMVQAVRAGDFDGDIPAVGFEVGALVGLGSPDDRWGTFVRAVYTNEDSQSARLGVFTRLY